jgi:hypothetical protein
MTAFLTEIGKKLYVMIWLNQVLDGLAYDTLFFYTFLQICCCIGLYGIFAKMNAAKWWAVLPAANIARLGDICGMKAAGFILGLSRILMLLVCENIVQIEFLIPTEGFLLAGTMALVGGCIAIVQCVAGFFVFRVLISRFKAKKRWLVPFLIVPDLTIFFWGLNAEMLEA